MKKLKSHLIGLAAFILLNVLDRWTKDLACARLKGQEPVVIWKNVFELTYLENRGMAFGLLQDQRILFLVLTAVVAALILFALWRLPEGKRTVPMRAVLVLLLSGALGNAVDRALNGYVVDFLYFKLINFPVFNVADIYVTGSAFALAYLALFYYKENELNLFRRN